MKAAKQIPRYMKGRPLLEITFGRGHFKLEGLFHASFANLALGCKSASDYLLMHGGRPIVYGSKLQRLTTENPGEAELLSSSIAVQ